MHISKAEAEARAIRLACDFMRAESRPGDPWTYRCLGASPDRLAPGFKKRKIVVKWVVSFEWSHEGVPVDGPIGVDVDIATEVVGRSKFDSP